MRASSQHSTEPCAQRIFVAILCNNQPAHLLDTYISLRYYTLSCLEGSLHMFLLLPWCLLLCPGSTPSASPGTERNNP